MAKQVKLTAYDSKDRPTTDYGRAVGWGHNEKTLPRHGGGCSDALPTGLRQSFGNNAPGWLLKAERERRAAIKREREGK